MDIKTKLNEIFNEAFNGTRDSSLGSRKGFKGHEESLAAGAKRKRKEREKEKRLKQLTKDNEKSVKENGVIQHHPREFLTSSPLRLTLKEFFIHNLIEYVHTGEKSHLKDAISLMEEYPILHKFVSEKSKKLFNSNEMSVYSTREHLMEELGETIERPEGVKIVNLSIPDVERKNDSRSGYMIMETKISPDKILIYIPAFVKEMEELIYSGKIEESETNVIREAKRRNELIITPSVNKGVVVKINK